MINSTLSLHARAVARVVIAAGVFAFCIAADCAVLAYELGRQTGVAVHARNDQLARVARRILAPAEPEPAPAPEPVAPAPEPAAVAPAEPEPVPQADWASLTVRELRSITGARSKRLRKADLVAMAEAMAA